MKIQFQKESCHHYKKPKQLIRSKVCIREKKKRSPQQFFSKESVQGKWDSRKHTSELHQSKSTTLKKRSSSWKCHKKHGHSLSKRGSLKRCGSEFCFFSKSLLWKDSWKYRKKKIFLNRRSVLEKVISWKQHKKKKNNADGVKSSVAEVDRLNSSSPSIRYEESWDDPLVPTMLNPPPDEQQMGTEESSTANSRSSEILIAVSILTSTGPISFSSAITETVSSSSTESQLSIQCWNGTFLLSCFNGIVTSGFSKNL